MELARVAGRETMDSKLHEFGKDLVNALLLDNTDVDAFEQGPGKSLCSYLDGANKLDGDLQFLRLPEAYSVIPCSKVIKYRCQLANESESFYRCTSMQDQWLRTVLQPQEEPAPIEIRSNVVPRRAYLTKLAGMKPTCPGHESCAGGFFPTSVLLREGEPLRQSCTKCALAEHLREGAHGGAGRVALWELAPRDIDLAGPHALLGEGSEGEVHKVFWRKGIFARKQFRCSLDQGFEVPSRNINFDREIQIARELSHPNIVHYFGCSRVDTNFRYVSLFMELLEGSLRTHIYKRSVDDDPFLFQDILDVLSQIAEAMKHMHEKNFLHGDLKPENILLSQLAMPHSKVSKYFYLVKVADFGCAQRVDSSGATVEEFRLTGTTQWAAPEVLRCRMKEPVPKHPQKVDVYSFGVVAYQVLTGVTEPYGDIPVSKIFKERVTNDECPLRPDFGLSFFSLDRDRRSLLPLVRSCWHPDPQKRPSFSDICEKLNTLSTEHRQRGKKAIWHSIGDVLEKLLESTITMCCNRDSTDSTDFTNSTNSTDSTDSTDST